MTIIGPHGDPVLGPLKTQCGQVESGDFFISLPPLCGDSHGGEFIETAIKNGASSILYQRTAWDPDRTKIPEGILLIAVDNARCALSHFARLAYPKSPKKIVGITGTSGKTSVATFVRQLMGDDRGAASIGTLGVEISKGENARLFKQLSLTSPGAIEIHQILQDLNDAGIQLAALEVSSHALDQHRMDSVPFTAGAFTNLSQDHLDYHGTMESYFHAKKRFFEDILFQDDAKNKTAVVYAGDEYGRRLIKSLTSAGRRIITCGGDDSDVTLVSARPNNRGVQVTMMILGRRCDFFFPILGDFQLNNLMIAIGLCYAVGESIDDLISRIPLIKSIPGRLEWIGTTPRGGDVFVDYAHKPGAIEQVLKAIRPTTSGRLWIVFGCGGNRDALKRPLMGGLAERGSDHVVITDDNPRFENPAAIRAAILGGITDKTRCTEITSGRRDAIFFALTQMEKGDTCVIAGKGHEKNQIVGDESLPFDDRDVARDILIQLEKAQCP